jgi:diguanylate cyclase (GGDEF)-like protein/PAS domain S-box-containing protein
MSNLAAADLQRQLDELLEHMPAGVVVLGPDGRIRSANRLACALLERPQEQLEGTESDAASWHLVKANNAPMATADYPVNVVLRTGKNISHMIVGVPLATHPHVRWLICNAYPEFDDVGRLKQVVVCFTDCTPLKRAKQRLQKSEKRLRLVLRGSSDAPWDVDLVTGEVYYSERWWAMLGYAPGALAGGKDVWKQLVHPDELAELEAFMRQLLAEPRESFSVETRLRHRDGHYVPVLSRGFVLRDRAGRPLRVSGTNTDLTERKMAERRIYEAAYSDHLTGLPNRRFLTEELERVLARSQRSGRIGALLFLDLDNFKLLNDTLGHDLGDALLRHVGQRLRHTLRHSDQLVRLGGDEFVIVLEELGHAAADAAVETKHVVEKITVALGQPYYLSGRLVLSTPSIGMVLFDGTSASMDTLLRQADLALYRAKADGRNTARQFVLYCQPQFSGRGRLVGAEVLVRWHREGDGLVGPAEFIGLAEASGLIVPLGLQVLEDSCRALARWRHDPLLGKIKLAVNVSARQLRDPAFSSDVARLLAKFKVAPGRLLLELTESVLADNIADTIARMDDLCSHGVRFSLDDFGTGYSSLAYLKRFPLVALKIDRSFVHDVHVDPDAAPIVEAIIALAKRLKLDVVAEGVEHEDQRNFLVGGGCGTLQGFLLGRPMPIEDFERRYGTTGRGHA